MDKNDKKTKKMNSIAVAVTALFAIVMFFLFHSYPQHQETTFENDEFLKETIETTGKIKSYSQHVKTEAFVGTNKIIVVGNYDIDNPRKSFKAQSETTTSFEGKKHMFTLTNISIGNNIYTKIETNSELIKLRMPETNKWHHFKADQISSRYKGIAIHGPIVNNLKLFGERGKYIDVVEKHNDGHYTLKLSDKALEQEARQLLGTIVERIGMNGTIDIWIDKQTLNITTIDIKNSSYRSVTTITNINNVPQIIAPVL